MKPRKPFFIDARWLLCMMTGNTKLVAIGVSKVCAVVVGVVLRPQARLAVTHTAICQSDGVNLIDLFARVRQERNCLPVARVMRLLVKRSTNEEQGPRLRSGLPTSPWTLVFLKAKGNAQRLKNWLVKSQCSGEVAYANHDVRKHLASPWVCLTFEIRGAVRRPA